MNLADLREQRSHILADADVLMQSPTAESRTAFDAKMAEVDGIDADIKRLERIASEPTTRTNRPNPTATEDRSACEKRAFREYITKGFLAPENRDFLTINANGSALIPQAFYPELISAQKIWGGLINVVNQVKTDTGAPMKVALVNDTATIMTSNTEGTAQNGTDPITSSILVNTEELRAGAVKVSLDELNDSAFDLDAWFRTSFGKIYYRSLNYYMTHGSSSAIQSVVSGYASNEITTGSAGIIKYADILALYASLEPAYIPNATFVMNSNTKAALMGITDTLGRPLLDPNANSAGFQTLFGCPVVINQELPNIASTKVSIQFGDYNAGYMLRTVNPGLAVIRLNERFMDTLEVGFVGYARAGGAVTNAGIAPIINLVTQ